LEHYNHKTIFELDRLIYLLIQISFKNYSLLLFLWILLSSKNKKNECLRSLQYLEQGKVKLLHGGASVEAV
jgi:hypothetical protein